MPLFLEMKNNLIILKILIIHILLKPYRLKKCIRIFQKTEFQYFLKLKIKIQIKQEIMHFKEMLISNKRKSISTAQTTSRSPKTPHT